MVNDTLWLVSYSYEDPEECDGLPIEIERVLITVEENVDIEAAMLFWAEEMGVFFLGYIAAPYHGKPEFHLLSDEVRVYV